MITPTESYPTDAPAERPPDDFPFPPSTGPTWPPDVDTRADAIAFGRKHADALAALERLAAKNGGGVMGLVKGVLAEYVRRQLITANDKERLLAIFTAFQNADIGAASQRIQELHDAAVSDPTSKPLALAVSSTAATNAAAAASTDNARTNAFAAGASDVVGIALGGFGGPIVALASGVAVSAIVGHTHVSVSWDG